MSEEVRVTNETTGGQKGSKIERFDLIPGNPLAELAELYGKGAKKYADRNWERGYDWNLSFAALQRHAWAFWNGEDLIPQTPEDEPDDPTADTKHMIAVAWHALALAQFMDEHRELDTRPHVSKATAETVACEMPTTTYETVKAARAVGLLDKSDPAGFSNHLSKKDDSFLVSESELAEANPDMVYWDNDTEVPVKEEEED